MFGASGLAAAVNGFYKGREEETARQNAEEDRAYAREQRAHQKTQQGYQLEAQARQRDQWGREDTLRKDLASVKSTKQVTIPGMVANDDDGNAMPAATRTVKLTQDEQLRQAADAFKNAGDFGRYLEATAKADEIGIRRAAEKAVQLEAASAGKSAIQIAEMAKQIFEDDPFPQKVRSYRDDGAGGVIAEIENTDTGKVTTQTYKTAADITNGMKSLYSPQAWAALQQMRQAAAVKAQGELAKPFDLKPGEKRFALGADGRMVQVAENDPTGMVNIGTAENPQWIRPRDLPGAGRAGKAVDPLKAVGDAFEFIATKGEIKLQPDQLARGARIAKQLVTESGGKLAPELAAEVAYTVTANPEKAEPSVDLQTGKIVTAYNHPEHGEFVISRLPPQGAKPEVMKRAVQVMLEKTEAGSPGAGKRLQAAAFSDDARTRLEAELDGEMDRRATQDVATNPQQAESVRANWTAIRQATRASLGEKLKLIKQYGTAPEEAPKRDLSLIDRLKGTGGLASASKYVPPADSPAGRSQALTQKAQAERAQREAAEQAERDKLSQQFQADAKTMTPLALAQKYDALRGKLPTQDAAQLQAIERQIR